MRYNLTLTECQTIEHFLLATGMTIGGIVAFIAAFAL